MWSACSENVMICFDLNRMNKLYGKLDRATKSLIFFTSRGWEVELDFMIVFTFYNMFLKSMVGLIMTIDVMWTHERILIGWVWELVPRGMVEAGSRPAWEERIHGTLRVMVKDKNTFTVN